MEGVKVCFALKIVSHCESENTHKVTCCVPGSSSLRVVTEVSSFNIEAMLPPSDGVRLYLDLHFLKLSTEAKHHLSSYSIISQFVDSIKDCSSLLFRIVPCFSMECDVMIQTTWAG